MRTFKVTYIDFVTQSIKFCENITLKVLINVICHFKVTYNSRLSRTCPISNVIRGPHSCQNQVNVPETDRPCQIKPESDSSWPQEDNLGRKTTGQ